MDLIQLSRLMDSNVLVTFPLLSHWTRAFSYSQADISSVVKLLLEKIIPYLGNPFHSLRLSGNPQSSLCSLTGLIILSLCVPGSVLRVNKMH